MNRELLRGELQRLAFTPVRGAGDRPRIGAEVEMLAVDAATGRPSPIEPGGSSTGAPTRSLEWLRPLAARLGWRESRTAKGAPCFCLDDGSTIGFEPGGQIEYSSAPRHSASALVHRVRSVIASLREAADDAGVALLHVGIDPTNPIERVALQLDQPRYIRMDAYLASRGESGRRMMRQTAATQVAVDLGPTRLMFRRWRLLNAAVPYVVAAFANSSRYAGRDTGEQSYRCRVWRTLDPTRTGVVGIGIDPVGEYLDFALRAPAMFHPNADGQYDTFDHLAERGLVNGHDWEEHLSSLFPEVRPRGYFEIRSIDAVPPEWLPAVVGVIGGIVYDPRTADAAADLLPHPSVDTLARAGRVGVGDEAIASVARDLLALGLDGCMRLGAGFIEPGHLDEIRAIIEQRTARGMPPADCSPAAAVANSLRFTTSAGEAPPPRR